MTEQGTGARTAAPQGGAASARRRAPVPEATIARLPVYLRALHALAEQGAQTVSSEALAQLVGSGSAKVRKDLSHLGSYGTRGVGYEVEELVFHISRELGLTQGWSVVLVGVGNLGHALAGYGGFASRGFRVAALLDADPRRVGEVVAGQRVRPVAELADASPSPARPSASSPPRPQAAQDVCDALVAAGVTSILNFAPAVLQVPDGVDLRKVDLALELQILSFHQHRRTRGAVPEQSVPERPRRCRHERPRRRRLPPQRPGRAARAASPSGLHDTGAVVDQLRAGSVSEAVVLSTCNRVEVYADTEGFHAGVDAVSDLLARCSGVPLEELKDSLYVHWEGQAVQHLFQVACGLDSMVVGEAQILGQLRRAYGASSAGAGRDPARAVPEGAARSASARTPRPASTTPAARWSPSGSTARRRRRPAGGPRGARHRRGLDGRAGRQHAAPGRRRAGSPSPTAPPRTRTGSPPRSRASASASTAWRPRSSRADVVVSSTGRHRAGGRRRPRARGPSQRAAAGRSPSSTSPCRATSTPRCASCPG